MRTLSAFVVLLLGCGGSAEAPEELGELSTFVFQHQPTASDAVMADAVRNLVAATSEIDLEGSRLGRSWIPDPLTLDHTDGLAVPEGADPEVAIAVGLVASTRWEPQLHAELATRVDQAPAEPSAIEYTRTFLEPVEPACFGRLDCAELLTVNDIWRETAIYSARFELWKGFRVVDVDGQDAIIARTWMEESVLGDQGATEIVQAYTIDVVLLADEGPRRVQVLWSETDVGGLSISDDLVRGTMRNGIDALFARTDEAIEELGID